MLNAEIYMLNKMVPRNYIKSSPFIFYSQCGFEKGKLTDQFF